MRLSSMNTLLHPINKEEKFPNITIFIIHDDSVKLRKLWDFDQ